MITFIYIFSLIFAIFQICLMVKMWYACDDIKRIANKFSPQINNINSINESNNTINSINESNNTNAITNIQTNNIQEKQNENFILYAMIFIMVVIGLVVLGIVTNN